MSKPLLYHVAHDEFVVDIRTVAGRIGDGDWTPDYLVGLGRGGLAPSTYLSHALGMTLLTVDYSSQDFSFADELLHKLAYRTRKGEKFLLVDDINDSGSTICCLRETIERFGGQNDHFRVAVLLNNIRSAATVDYCAREIDRSIDKRWFVFPWEAMAPIETTAKDAIAVPERLG